MAPIATKTEMVQRRDSLYHCCVCPSGPDNSFDRLTARTGNESQSFEHHVKKNHPDHDGEYKELLGPKTYKFRMIKKKVKVSAKAKKSSDEDSAKENQKPVKKNLKSKKGRVEKVKKSAKK